MYQQTDTVPVMAAKQPVWTQSTSEVGYCSVAQVIKKLMNKSDAITTTMKQEIITKQTLRLSSWFKA